MRPPEDAAFRLRNGLCVLEQGWNKTLQGCGPPGTEFDTPDLEALEMCVCVHAGVSNMIQAL